MIILACSFIGLGLFLFVIAALHNPAHCPDHPDFDHAPRNRS